jgi:hypothetical protein
VETREKKKEGVSENPCPGMGRKEKPPCVISNWETSAARGDRARLETIARWVLEAVAADQQRGE